MRCHVGMHHFTPGMAKHDKAVQHPKRRRGHGEEVDRYDVLKVIVKESLPSLRSRPLIADHVLGNRPFCNRVTQQLELRQDPWSAPKRILRGHLFDQFAKFRIDLRSSRLLAA